MMKASLKSGKREMLRFSENEDERVIKISSFTELLHYIIPAYRFFRFARAMDKEDFQGDFDEIPENFAGKKDGKPLRLKTGFFSIKLG